MAQARFTASRFWVLAPGAALALGLVGWIAPAASAPRAPATRVPQDTAGHPPGPEPRHLARITHYDATPTAPRLLLRSPFAFAPARSASVTTPSRRVADTARADQMRVDQPPAALEPLPALAGIAEQHEADGLVRTAIFLGPDGTIRFAAIGQDAGVGLRVTIIETDRVVVVNERTGRTAEFGLK